MEIFRRRKCINNYQKSTMTSSLTWYLTLTLLGLLTFPLAHRLFPALKDRGYTLSRAFGLLLWGFIFWLLASLGVIQNDAGGILLALVLLMGLVAWSLAAGGKFSEKIQDVSGWFKDNWRLVLATEVLFLAAFSFMALVRSANPESLGTEKPMELAFINAILRSPTFPPHDPWLSGYAISYYYFGYVMAALLAKVTATSGGVAFNLMLASLFALNAVGAFGVGYDLLSAYSKRETKNSSASNILPSFLFPLFLLIVSNFEGFLEVLHRLKIGWSDGPNFWTWLGILNLKDAPPAPLSEIPTHWYWWWRASRVITDYSLSDIHQEVIDEFPAFSYVLGDLHPHVLAMPFVLLVVAMTLNVFLRGWEGETNLFGLLRPKIKPVGFAVAAVVLGGMAFLNTWDFPILLTLFCSAYILTLVHDQGWRWSRALDFLELAIPLGILSILLYLPFYLGFQSQAGGILPNLVNPSRGAHLWVMFGPFFILLFAFLLYHWRSVKTPANWKNAWWITIIGFLALWLFSWLLTLIGILASGLLPWLNYISNTLPWFLAWLPKTLANLIQPNVLEMLLASQGMPNLGILFFGALIRRLQYSGGLFILFFLSTASLAFLAGIKAHPENSEPQKQSSTSVPGTFIFLLIFIGAMLVIVPEFFYLKDGFGNRMNTVFKFYYQAWLMWSLAAAFGTIILLRELRGAWRWVFAGIFVVVLSMAMVYAPLAFGTKTNHLKMLVSDLTLDASEHMNRSSPDDAAAINWLKTAPLGVVAEAVGGQYSEYARAATYSGQPNVIGWPGHEGQWRGGYNEVGSRPEDMRALFETRIWDEARAILDKYDITYVYIGNLERNTYNLFEEKFRANLPVAYEQGSVTIYIVP
jgi:YYY domain-containing protein